MFLSHFIPKSRITRASFLYTILFLSVIIYFEFLQVWFNSSTWNQFNENGVRILIVADPQLLGEHGEFPFIGTFTRWHADRYVSQNFKVAKYHTQPDVIIFLGDIFDEMATATETEANRYLRRFQSVFQLHETVKQGNKKIIYIFLPGDNDVGGEGNEKIDIAKVDWFNRTVGDLQSPVLLETPTGNIQFIKMNLLLPKLSTLIGDSSKEESTIKIALSHYPCMEVHEACAKNLLNVKPNILLSAHTHSSEYFQHNEQGHIQYFLPNILVPGANSIGTTEAAKRMGLDLQSTSLKFHLNSSQSVFHHIVSPTCSYRMGKKNMGFGLLIINENEVVYRVLWLPSGFKPLIIYITFYVVSKIIFTPWFLYKILQFIWPKLRNCFGLPTKNTANSIAEKAHLV